MSYSVVDSCDYMKITVCHGYWLPECRIVLLIAMTIYGINYTLYQSFFFIVCAVNVINFDLQLFNLPFVYQYYVLVRLRITLSFFSFFSLILHPCAFTLLRIYLIMIAFLFFYISFLDFPLFHLLEEEVMENCVSV